VSEQDWYRRIEFALGVALTVAVLSQMFPQGRMWLRGVLSRADRFVLGVIPERIPTPPEVSEMLAEATQITREASHG
jgi:hypothetical protein